MRESFIISDDYAARVNLTLEPFYGSFRQTTSCFDGNEPSNTTYEFNQRTQLYRILRNSPRYIIWTKDDPLLACGTVVDRIDLWELFEAFLRAKSWAYAIESFKSIAVFDLDKTLIDDDCNKIECCEQFLTYARHNYDLLVLWSHGSPLHVDEQLEKLRIGNLWGADIFNLVIKGSDVKSAKNLLWLYNHFPYTKFTKSVLIDDLVANWTPEYDKFLIPFNNKTLIQGLALI